MTPRTCRRCLRSMVGQHDAAPVGMRKHLGRGLCDSCYSWAWKYGRLDDFPRLKRSAAEVADEHAFLSAQGLRPSEIAAQLGLKQASMERALLRHRARQCVA